MNYIICKKKNFWTSLFTLYSYPSSHKHTILLLCNECAYTCVTEELYKYLIDKVSKNELKEKMI